MMYTFTEIADFDLDDYIPHMGWLGDKPFKIYSKEGTESYYLYEEQNHRLFEFTTGGEKLSSNTAYIK